MISVIVPVYNAESTLERCVDSIFVQRNSDFELILVDDGSSDSSPLMCDKYAQRDARVRVFHQKNKGVSAARNLGLKECHGEWITFIDSDDFIQEDFFPNHLDEKYDWIIQNRKTIFADGTYDVSEIIPSQRVEKSQIGVFCSNYAQYDVLRGPWGKFFKRSIISANCLYFDEDLRLGEDTLFCVQYFALVSSIYVAGYSFYIHNFIQGEEAWITRYQMSVKVALSSLRKFYKGYEKLPGQNKQLLRLVYDCYYKVILHSNRIVHLLDDFYWNSDNTVIIIKRHLNIMQNGKKNMIRNLMMKGFSFIIREK